VHVRSLQTHPRRRLWRYEVEGDHNSKKYIEEGMLGENVEDAHKAAIIGDTFGDPLKDTAGPSIHILIKLLNIVSITLLPIFVLLKT
jgi:Na+/H+-translocating membrane pyrophosphatase